MMVRLAALVALFPALALAQVPQKLGYQGRLLKADGTPETGVVSVTFALFGQSTGGSAIWTEQQSLALSDGFYATTLGDTTAIPGGLFDGSERFLEVATAGNPLSPRTRVVSIPYAMMATTARDLSGGTVNASSISVGGNTVIDSSGKLAGSAAYQAGSGLTLTGNTFALLGNCSAGQILKWSGSAWQCEADAGFTPQAGPGIAVSGSTIGLGTCPNGQVWKSTGTGWACAEDKDTDTDTVFTPQAGPGIAVSGSTIGLGTCPNGQVWKSTGNGWACAADNNTGSVTAVTASAPLASSGGATPNLTLAKATASADGYLAKEDFKSFGAKRSTPGPNLIEWVTDAGRWTQVDGASGTTVTLNTSDVVEGDSSYQFTTPSATNQGAWFTYGDFIPVNPNKKYFGRISAKLFSGAGTFYAGYVAYNASKQVIGGNGGTFGYFIANSVALTSSWSHFANFINGQGTQLYNFPNGTRFIKPLIIVNYNNTGTTLVDDFSIQEAEPSMYVSPWVSVNANSTTYSFAHNFGFVPTSCDVYWSTSASGSPKRQLDPFNQSCHAGSSPPYWQGAARWYDATNAYVFLYGGGYAFCFYDGNWRGYNSAYLQVVCYP